MAVVLDSVCMEVMCLTSQLRNAHIQPYFPHTTVAIEGDGGQLTVHIGTITISKAQMS